MSDAITEFRGNHFFLSNFSPAVHTIAGIEFPTTEHSYQALKTRDHVERLEISMCATPGDAKRMGQKITLRDGWENTKVTCMYLCLVAKFTQNHHLGILLIETGQKYLEEGNQWGDTYWGTVNGAGSNMLGHTLMRVRNNIRPIYT